MTNTWLIAAAGSPRTWLLPAALAVVLIVQIGGFLAVERIVKARARRRRDRGDKTHA